MLGGDDFALSPRVSHGSSGCQLGRDDFALFAFFTSVLGHWAEMILLYLFCSALS